MAPRVRHSVRVAFAAVEQLQQNANPRFVIPLGLPSLGLTFAVTVLTAYVPTVLVDDASPIVIGFIVGIEGLFGLFLPLIFGVLADRVGSVVERLRFVVPAALAAAAGLLIVSFTNSVAAIAVAVMVFYVGYYAYLAPYWALYPDLIPKEYAGRARSAEGVWRVIGSVLALIAGGLLIAVWQPLPFVLAAVGIGAVTVVLYKLISKRGQIPLTAQEGSFKESLHYLKDVMAHNRELRTLMITNACWNATLRSIQAFVVIFFTQGLGRSEAFVSGVVFPVAGIGILIMAPLVGRLADGVGTIKVLVVSVIVFGAGTMVIGLSQAPWLIVLVPIVTAAATAVMTLPEAMLMRVVKPGAHGASSGLFGLSRGAGSFLGPVACGFAIYYGADLFPSSNGYAAFWVVASTFCLISLPLLLMMKKRHEPKDEPVIDLTNEHYVSL